MGTGIEVAEPPRLLGRVRLQDVHDRALMERDVRTLWLVKVAYASNRGAMALVTVSPSIVWPAIQATSSAVPIRHDRPSLSTATRAIASVPRSTMTAF